MTAAFASAALFGGQAALAQAACEDRDQVIELLAEKYHETPSALGVTNEGSLVEVLTNDEDGTWSIVMTSPQGTSCLLLTGEGWKHLLQAVLEPEA